MPLEGIFVFRYEHIVFKRYSRMLLILSRQRKQTACQRPKLPFHLATHQKTCRCLPELDRLMLANDG